MATILNQPPTSGRDTGRRPPPRAGVLGAQRSAVPGLRSGILALAGGITAAALLLSGALHAEYPLFAEASAARGRDCSAIASARHALDAALEAGLPIRPADADDAREVRSSIATFDARTSDLVTPSVAVGLADVRGRLSELAGRVQAASAPGAPPEAAAGVETALAALRHAWKGRIARVCS